MPEKTIEHLIGYVTSTQYPHGHPDHRPPQPFVTISRQAGAGGITVGKLLCDQLNASDSAAATPWSVIDQNLLQTVVEEHDLPAQIANRLNPTQYSTLLKWCDDMFGNFHPTWSTLIRKTGETILHLARMGNVVIVGRGAHILTRALPGGFHVRLVGSVPRRTAHLQEYYNLTEKTASAMLERNDRGRIQYVRDVFKSDLRDVTGFDLCINTDHISYKNAAGIIASQVMRIRKSLVELPEPSMS